ncbi:MAG: acyltransferase [Bacteroidales bacterium]|nr:acyltransferase [Bacteroidales bacterium]MBN2698774.1 acyltransferase [Bacteroidales bacterium]
MFESKIFNISSKREFQELALEIFYYQAEHNPVYKQYISLMGCSSLRVTSISDIPFLPVDFFRTHVVRTRSDEPACIFESSGTTGSVVSKHYLSGTDLYEESISRCFSLFYGNVSRRCILSLLPSYLERGNSSLVYMMNHLIKKSNHPDSGFYLNDFASLSRILISRTRDGVPTLLLGVSFALLDFAVQYPASLSDNIIIMETGGMKGRRPEITRTELHDLLKQAFNLEQIHSEYGMTEMLSQAYSKGNGLFYPPPWMKIICRDTHDPRSLVKDGQTGGINIIDLANIYSCCFLETSDLGKCYANGGFEILGRYDHSDIRGCNLLSG